MTADRGDGLFDGLDVAARDRLRSRMGQRELSPGTVLCRAGDRSDSLYVVERGFLEAFDPWSGRVLGRQYSGDVVGEVALLTGEPRSATLVAQVPSVVSELSRDDFLAAASNHPRLLANLAAIVSRRLVARTVSPASRVSALVVPPTGWAGASAALEVARACSVAPMTVLDVDAEVSISDLRGRIAAGAASGPVLVAVRTDFEHLPELLGRCDRTVAVGNAAHEGVALPADADVVGPDADAGRVGRLLARASVGIALGAGGAKGWAHVGVLRSLQRAGYRLDAVAGSSVGAWVGAWTALGHDADGVEQLMRETFDAETVHAVFRQGDPQGTAVMTKAARETTGDARFRDLGIPLTVLAADLSAQEPAVLSEGRLAPALVTAMTVPGLYPPVRRGDRRLVDAVVIAPVPTAALAGVDVTIAVNTLAGPAMSAWPGDDAEPSHVPRDRDTVVESLELASRAAAATQTAEAAVGVTPRFGPGTWRDFGRADRYLAAGEEAMEEALGALGALARPG